MGLYLRQTYETVPIKHLRPHPENPWQSDPALIEGLIETNGFYGCIIAQRSTGYILAGHRRYKALKKLKQREVPVMWLDIGDDTARRIVLSDNKSGESRELDSTALYTLLAEMEKSEIGLAGTAYTEDDLASLIDGLTEDIAASLVPPTEEDTVESSDIGLDTHPDGLVTADDIEVIVVQTGDVWRVGNHIVVCGDCTEAFVAEQCIQGCPIHMSVTDPPYGVAYDPSWREHRSQDTIQNDTQCAGWSGAYANYPGNILYVWHPGRYGKQHQQDIEQSGFVIRSQIIWNKHHYAISRGHYHWKHEPCFYAVREGKTASWVGGNDQCTVWDAPMLQRYVSDRPSNEDDRVGHPTQKPVILYSKAYRNHCSPGQHVYDPFLGSGTALVAAHSCGLVCHGIDIDPRWVQYALLRMETLFHLDAVRSDGVTLRDLIGMAT